MTLIHDHLPVALQYINQLIISNPDVTYVNMADYERSIVGTLLQLISKMSGCKVHNLYYPLGIQKAYPSISASTGNHITTIASEFMEIALIHDKGQTTFLDNDILLIKLLLNTTHDHLSHLMSLQRLKKSEQIFQLTFQQVGTGVCQTDLDGYIQDANIKFCEIIGYTKEEVIGLRIKDLTHPDDWKIDIAFKKRLFQYEIPYFSMEKRYFRKDGSEIWVYITVTLVRADHYQNEFLIGVIQDISARKHAELILLDYTGSLERQISERTQELTLAATTDPLTNTFNRRYMNDCLHAERERYLVTNKVFSILLLDIDYFKHINDQYGHGIGDHVLIDISNTIHSLLRNEDTLSRWGGEEFLILLPGTNTTHAYAIAERIRTTIQNMPISASNHTINVTITLGAITMDGNLSITDLLLFADKALYLGKKKGRNCTIISDKQKQDHQ